jgi:hypothetical protein
VCHQRVAVSSCSQKSIQVAFLGEIAKSSGCLVLLGIVSKTLLGVLAPSLLLRLMCC